VVSGVIYLERQNYFPFFRFFGANCYATGTFTSDAMIGDVSFTSRGLFDIYIVKYNMDGVFQWALEEGGDHTDVEVGIAVDGLQNVYVTGAFFSDMATIGDTILVNSEDYDVFIAKYSPTVIPIPTLDSGVLLHYRCCF
jgi:hypothetical protein